MIYLGTIANAGSDVLNNKTTATPFAIPSGTIALRLLPSAGTLLAAVKLGDDASFLPADATTMLQLGAANSFNDLTIHGAPMMPHTPTLVTLAVRKSDAGSSTCKVFAVGI